MESVDPLVSQMESISIHDPIQEPELQCDEELVAQFLYAGSCIDVAIALENMDKSKYNLLGCCIFEAFKRRQIEGQLLLCGGTEDPFDFDHATKIIMNILLTTNGFKTIVRYVRLQLLYGLERIKMQKEENSIQQETIDFIDERWKKLKSD